MSKRLRRAYLAGPMRSKPQFNYPLFMRAATDLRNRGWQIYNPAEMDLSEDGYDISSFGYSVEQQENFITSEVCRKYARRDLNCILDNLSAAWEDAIIVLPDWKESLGAKAEVALGRWLGLEIVPLREALHYDATPRR